MAWYSCTGLRQVIELVASLPVDLQVRTVSLRPVCRSPQVHVHQMNSQEYRTARTRLGPQCACPGSLNLAIQKSIRDLVSAREKCMVSHNPVSGSCGNWFTPRQAL